MIKTNKTLLTLSLWGAMAASAFAQGTAFTYQGQLNSAGVPANGTYDILFNLFPVSSGGSVTATVIKTGIGVTNGLFTTTVDFLSAYNGSSYWLELEVRTNGGTFSPPLTPRQQLTPTPYSVYAESANATNLVGTVAAANLPADAALLDANQTFTGNNSFSSNVGLGTTSPATRLNVVGTGTTDDSRVLIEATAATFGPQLRLKRDAPGGDEWLFVNNGTINGPVNQLELVQSSSGLARVSFATNGNVGIGTMTPSTALQVNGTVTASSFSGSGSGLIGISGANVSGVALLAANNTFTTDQTVIGQVTAGGSSGAITMLDRFHPVGGFGWQWVSDATGLNAERYNGGAGSEDFTISTNGNVGIDTSTPNADSQLQVNGMVRMGSETGTSQAPNKPIMIRRINSTSSATGQVVARSLTGSGNILTLERDGSNGGLIIKLSGANINVGGVQISGYGITASGAFVGVNLSSLANNSSTQVFTDSQKICNCRLTFGDPFNNSDVTTVEMMRFVDTGLNNDYFWAGTVTSTVNQ